ncbi:hypothetical protein PLICRDRAFT_45184 [Plicaturopsis crispa FD-325 SS-3]|uniref:Pali-domain-containing protein n=1 Tax=Plicaturopsis crispa FD-325 SS-3 TaxID=944288 RepID=A0A0C9SRV7_PLICR|nr:hypothetical protein PLICRDRAFT_45184 [Plicaturopsis crispa FD-325 SS-3]
MVYNHPVFPTFVLTFGAFALLTLTTFSVPMISSFYFLYASEAGGVRFGAWGWCLDSDGTCSSPLRLEYEWDPQVVKQLIPAHIFYPISVVLTFFGVVSLLPLLCGRKLAVHQYGLFSVLALLSFLSSFIAFIFTIAVWGTARTRFRQAGYDASFGPLLWMSVAATAALLLVCINSGCGTAVSCGRRKRPGEPPAESNRY